MTTPTIERAEIEREVRSFLITTFLFGNAAALRDDGSLLGEVIDSTGAVELVTFLQDRFSITVEDEEVAAPENFGSVATIVDFVDKKLRGKI